MIVLDASVVVDLLLGVGFRIDIATRLQDEAPALAPEIVDLEVANVLRKLIGRGAIDARRGQICFADYLSMPILRQSHRPLAGRIWALRENVTAYDAAYIALAEAAGASFLTRDAALARLPGLEAPVEVV